MRQNKTIIYARLSNDDKLDDISQSIQNQISICKDYANENNLTIDEIYYDDGYSGTNFERPQFKRMIEDIEKKSISIIIVKDLSRLGRNFLKTSYYIEDYFPSHKIRFISVNDNYDSSIITDDLSLPIKNFLNGLYAKECKKKRKLYIESNKTKKSFAIEGVYGYQLLDNKLIIDEVASRSIKLIYTMYLSNYKIKEIIDKLKENNFAIPSYHKQFELKSSLNFKITEEQKYNWTKDMIYRILKERQYTGDAVNIKSTKLSKNAKRTRNPSPTIIPNHHEPIISKEQFNEVQKKLKQNSYPSKINDSIRLKNFFISENGKVYCYREVRHNDNQTVGRRYVLNDLTHRFDADLAHDILYKDCINIYKQFKYSYDDFKEAYLNRINAKNDKKNLNNYYKEKKELNNRIILLFEKLALNVINEEEYKIKINKINERLKQLDIIINDYITSSSFNNALDQKIDNFYKITKDIELKKINRLDLIRIMISKVIVTFDEGKKLNFRIKYKFVINE